jgi:hypothetical protein
MATLCGWFKPVPIVMVEVATTGAGAVVDCATADRGAETSIAQMIASGRENEV